MIWHKMLFGLGFIIFSRRVETGNLAKGLTVR